MPSSGCGLPARKSKGRTVGTHRGAYRGAYRGAREHTERYRGARAHTGLGAGDGFRARIEAPHMCSWRCACECSHVAWRPVCARCAPPCASAIFSVCASDCAAVVTTQQPNTEFKHRAGECTRACPPPSALQPRMRLGMRPGMRLGVRRGRYHTTAQRLVLRSVACVGSRASPAFRPPTPYAPLTVCSVCASGKKR